MWSYCSQIQRFEADAILARGCPAEALSDAATPGTVLVVGSRVYFLIQNYSDVKDDLLGNLFSGAGLVWYGGVIGGGRTMRSA